MSFVDPLLKELNIAPNDLSVYELACTHSSVNGMAKTKHKDYERLEFLGDSLVGFVVSELCYKLHPEMRQGELSVLKAQFIRTESEANYARRLGLPEYIKVGISFQNKISESDSLLEDVFESFIGALLLDKGLEYAYVFVKQLFYNDVKEAKIIVEGNPKSELQEIIQAESRETLVYELISESGPAHNRTFEMAVLFEGSELGRGIGKSKKEAESNAAREALKKVARGGER